MPDKSWYTSVTLWGGIVMAVAFLASYLGYSITSQEQIELTQFLATIATAVGGLVGLIMVIIGRKNTGNEIKALKGIISKSLPMAKIAIEFPKVFIDITESMFGPEANALISVGVFLKTLEGKALIKSVKEAGQSGRGKILIEQLEKVVK